METPTQHTPLRLEDYQAIRETVFPSLASLQWFCRQHRRQLIDGGALISPTGRKLIVPSAFDAAVATIGRERAERDALKNYRTPAGPQEV